MSRLTSATFWIKSILVLFVICVLLFLGLIALIYAKQEQTVQQILTYTNQHYQGRIELDGSHISPFANFPDISIDLEGVRIYETKDRSQQPIVDVQDAFLGFDIWHILHGDYQLHSILLKEGYVKFIQHQDGSFNIVQALVPTDTASIENEESEPFQLNIENIQLENIDIHKVNEATAIDLDFFVNDAKAKLRLSGAHTYVDLDSRFEMNLIENSDTTFIKHKHFELISRVDIDLDKGLIQVAPSTIKLEMGEFNIKGSFDIENDQYIDLETHGTKPNFDLLIAFAPEELIPTLQSYENRGKVYFDATIQGSTANGNIPHIEAQFGCEKGMIGNNQNNKRVDDIAFNGYFRNGATGGGLETMEFGLKDFNARPEAGRFFGDLEVKNFRSPEIELQLNSQFDLGFLVAFFNLKGLTDMSGSVDLTMNFHDIIDLQNPEKSIERLNESYFTELEIRNLNFQSKAFQLPFKDLNLIGHVEGHKAYIDTISGQVGRSDIFVTGQVSDLPAILHHTDDSVWVNLYMRSDLLDVEQLTHVDSTKKGVDEQITDFELDMAFKSSARAFTESVNLPEGEFFIRNLHAQLEHYPHEFHDFNADLYIEKEDLRLIDFSGELDKSDFHFSGRMKHYDFWFNHVLEGDAELEFDLTCDHLYLEDVLVYKGENYIPADYQHEEFQGFKLHGRTLLHFKDHQMKSVDTYLEQLDCKMKVHQCAFNDFKGRIHYEDQHISTEKFQGRIGRSDFLLDLYWYTGKDPQLRKKDHYIHLVSDRLDINQLLEWELPSNETDTIKKIDHDAGFSVFNLPFWEMQFKAEVGELTYHQYKIKDMDVAIRMTEDRYIHIDTCTMEIADGQFDIKGYFNASDSNEIYFSPDFYAEGLDIDKFMVKFDNFGQDYVVSDNLHGVINCDISGKLHVHKDLTPMLEKSNFLIDLQAVNGRLDNYQPVEYLSDYFKDKNLKKIRFDTLQNTFKVVDHTLQIPVMTINSSLGFIELWGEQEMGNTQKMDLFVKVPLKMITRAVQQKLFKKKPDEIDPDQEDAIEYQDKSKKIAYVTVHLIVDENGYQIILQRDKNRMKDERKKKREERIEKRKARQRANKRG